MSGMAEISVSLSTWKAIEAARLSLGESHDEIMRRVLATVSNRRTATIRSVARTAPAAQRRRGNVSVDLFGRSQPVANLRAGYLAILNALVRHKPSLFELLAHEGSKRRRWCARDGKALFPDSPHLARDHAYAIHADWVVDTNLSRAQIEQRLAVAAKLSGYRYGEDVGIIGA